MNQSLQSALKDWQVAFKKELAANLSVLRQDPDIYGFALEVPADLGNLCIVSWLGRESALEGEKPNSFIWLERRYTPTDWEYSPEGQDFDETCRQLDHISEEFGSSFFTEHSEYTATGTEFRNSLYAACLDTMVRCDREGEFGNIWFKVISLSDDEHPVVRQSFNRLNSGRAKEEASGLYNGERFFSKFKQKLWMLYVRKIRSRKYRK